MWRLSNPSAETPIPFHRFAQRGCRPQVRHGPRTRARPILPVTGRACCASLLSSPKPRRLPNVILRGLQVCRFRKREGHVCDIGFPEGQF